MMFFMEDYDNMIFALNVTIIKQRSIVKKAKESDNELLKGGLPYLEGKLASLEDTKAKLLEEKEKLPL